MSKTLIFILTILFLYTGKSMAQFTTEERNLINSGDAGTPFRVLLITNKEDSLILRQKCSDVDPNTIVGNKDLELLIRRLATTMDVEQGIGIAAPQIGISKNIFLFFKIEKPDYHLQVAINPKIINHPAETVCFEGDGCLSVPDIGGNSIRYPWIEVEYTNQNGKLVCEHFEGYTREDNFTGIIFQHEYDHLQGVLFSDKLCIDNKDYDK